MMNLVERLYRCMQLAFGRGRIQIVDDSGNVQTVQVKFSDLETIDNIPLPHDFGFTSNPPPDSDVFAAFVGGNRKNGIVLAVGSQQYRLKNLKSGEAAIYSSAGQHVYLTETGIVIECAGMPLTVNNADTVTINASSEVDVNAPLCNVNGDAFVTGNATITGELFVGSM
jgi:phage baseplate assembly protein V